MRWPRPPSAPGGRASRSACWPTSSARESGITHAFEAGAARGDALARQVDRDGYFVVRGFFDPARVAALADELTVLLDRDEAARVTTDHRDAVSRLEGLETSVSNDEHIILQPSFRSPRMQRTIADVLTDPEIAHALRLIAGERFRLRVDLVRRASGRDDRVDGFQLPNPWHVDSPGEFTFGIFLDDLSRPASGATAIVRGSHRLAFDPLWDFVFGARSYRSREAYLSGKVPTLHPACWRMSPVNRWLRRHVRADAVELGGRPGDIYFFLNEAWHGRAANTQGRRFRMIRFGAIASDFTFKDDMPLPGSLSELIPELARFHRPAPAHRTDETTVLQRMRREQARPLLMRLARREKAILGACTVAASRLQR